MGSGDCPNCGAFGYCDTDCVRKVGKCANAEVTALRERVAQLEAEKAAETADTFSTAHDESPSFTPDALKDFATRNHERVNRWLQDEAYAEGYRRGQKSGIAAGESATVEAIAVWLESAGTDESVGYACDLRSGEWRKP
jgi:hypothetical protein